MVNIRNAFRRQDSVAGVTVPELENEKPPSFNSDDQKTHLEDEKETGLALDPEEVAADGAHKADYLHVAAKDIMANGKERPIEVSFVFTSVYSSLSSSSMLTAFFSLVSLLKISRLDACPSKTTPT